MNVGTSTDPTTGFTTITVPNGQVSGTCTPLPIEVKIDPGGGTVSNANLVLVAGGVEKRYPLTDSNNDGIWTATIGCITSGHARRGVRPDRGGCQPSTSGSRSAAYS